MVTAIMAKKNKFGGLGVVARAICLCFAISCFAFASSTVLGTERSRNLRQLDYVPMLWEYHRQTVGNERQFFAYPARDTNFRTRFIKENQTSPVSFVDTLGSVSSGNAHIFGVAVSPSIGIDFRGGESLKDTVWPGIDAGLQLRGFADSLDFELDARMYFEQRMAGIGNQGSPKSFDGEVFDVQNENQNDGGMDYVSYSRYRAHMGLNYAYARLEIARDVLHFGPGYFNNLSLNQFALPYNMLTLDLKFGPLHVLSAYGDLRVNNWSYSLENLNHRNLYAHRYELNLFDNDMVVGVSEMQVLYNENKAWLFVPLVPLFIEKGNYTERVNNGAVSMDLSFRIFNSLRLYGEFLLDDMESPAALYENRYSNNRWAAMAGVHLAGDFYAKNQKIQVGSIMEIARVEPFTYCHYDTAAAQLSHLGEALGNPNGPNSLSLDWLLYGRFLERLFLGYRSQWLWKGDDEGSRIDDPYRWKEKRFVHGAAMRYSGSLSLSFRGRFASYFMEYKFGYSPAVWVRAMFVLW